MFFVDSNFLDQIMTPNSCGLISREILHHNPCHPITTCIPGGRMALQHQAYIMYVHMHIDNNTSSPMRGKIKGTVQEIQVEDNYFLEIFSRK